MHLPTYIPCAGRSWDYLKLSFAATDHHDQSTEDCDIANNITFQKPFKHETKM